MTLPHERTRSLVFGLEFLAELCMADNLTPEQRHTLEDILRAYPTFEEIQAWAADCQAQGESLACLVPDLAPDEESMALKLPDGFQIGVRPPIEPWQRARSLSMMEQFLRELWRAQNLTHQQKVSIPYVQRHFFERWRLESMARQCEAKLRQDPTLKVWLLPQPRHDQQGESQKTEGIPS